MKKILKDFLRSFGFDLVRYYPSALERAKAIEGKQKGANFLKMLTYHEIDLILDVGANIGQYANSLFEIGYQGKIISFEPLSSAYEKLVKASDTHPNWEVMNRCAVGNRNGEIEIHISENSESSSVLNILPAHVDAAKRSAYIDSEKVEIYRLSDLIRERLCKFQAPFLKVDVQGYEDKVLQGAEEILPQIRGLYLEMSLVPLYEGQKLFEEMLRTVKEMGFSLYNLTPGFYDYRTGRRLQIMGTFFREKET